MGRNLFLFRIMALFLTALLLMLVLVLISSFLLGGSSVRTEPQPQPQTGEVNGTSGTRTGPNPPQTLSQSGAAGGGGQKRDIDLTGLDPDGNILWHTRLSGEGEDYLNLKDILMLPDGGSVLSIWYHYIKPGICSHFELGSIPCSYQVPRLIRLDGNGLVLWDQNYENLRSYYWFGSVGRTTDGGFTAYGSPHILHFLDGEGNVEKCLKVDPDLYDTDLEHGVHSMVPGPGGNLLAVGGIQYYFHPVVYMPGWLAVFDRDGTMAWEVENRSAKFIKGIPTSDGGYLVAGEFWGFQTFIQKLDAEGNIRWSTNLSCKSYFGSDVREKDGFQVLCYTPHILYLVDKDGRNTGELDPVQVSGNSSRGYSTRLGFTSDGNFWRMDPVSGTGVRISKFDAGGRVLWEKDFPAGEGIAAVPGMIRGTSDGGLLVARYAGRDSFPTGSTNRSPWTLARTLPEEACTPTPLTTLIGREKLVLNENPMIYPYSIRDSPLIIEYNLSVPILRATRLRTDPDTGKVLKDSIPYPDPAAYFDLAVKDLDTDSVITRESFAGPYNNIYNKRVWIRYPGNYSIEISGNRVTAEVKFMNILRREPAAIPGNLTVMEEKSLVFLRNVTAYQFELQNPPLLIDYTLTVPNITRAKLVTDPVTGKHVTTTTNYPDPAAYFEVTVRDMITRRIIAQNGFGGQYDVTYRREVWVRSPGNYYIEFSGNRVMANIRFLVNRTS